MVKVKPLAAKKVIDFNSLIKELKQHIAHQEEVIERNNDRLEEVQNELNTIKQDIVEAHEQQQRMMENADPDTSSPPELIQKQSTFRITVVECDDGDEEDTEQNGKSAVDSQSPKLPKSPVPSTGKGKRRKHHQLTLTQFTSMGMGRTSRVISLEVQPHIRLKSEVPAVLQIQLETLEKQEEDEAAALYNPLVDEHGDTVSPTHRVRIAAEKEDAHKVIDESANEKAMELALLQHRKLHQKEQTVTQLAKDFDFSALIKDEVVHMNMNMDTGYQSKKDEVKHGSEYSRLKAVQYRKLNAEELEMYLQHEAAMTKNLQQACNVMSDYLQDEFEGLLTFFRVRRILPKQRINIQW